MRNTVKPCMFNKFFNKLSAVCEDAALKKDACIPLAALHAAKNVPTHVVMKYVDGKADKGRYAKALRSRLMLSCNLHQEGQAREFIADVVTLGLDGAWGNWQTRNAPADDSHMRAFLAKSAVPQAFKR